MMLFLKHVQNISLYEWKEGAAQPACFFQTGVVNISRRLSEQRNFVSTALAVVSAAAATRDTDGTNGIFVLTL